MPCGVQLQQILLIVAKFSKDPHFGELNQISLRKISPKWVYGKTERCEIYFIYAGHVLNHEEVSVAGRNMSKNEEINLPVFT